MIFMLGIYGLVGNSGCLKGIDNEYLERFIIGISLFRFVVLGSLSVCGVYLRNTHQVAKGLGFQLKHHSFQ